MPLLKVRGARLTNDFLIFRVKGDFCDSFARSKIFFIDLPRRFSGIDHFHTKTENRKSLQKRSILFNKSYCGKKKIFFEQGRENTQFYSFYLNLNVCHHIFRLNIQILCLSLQIQMCGRFVNHKINLRVCTSFRHIMRESATSYDSRNEFFVVICAYLLDYAIRFRSHYSNNNGPLRQALFPLLPVEDNRYVMA